MPKRLLIAVLLALSSGAVFAQTTPVGTTATPTGGEDASTSQKRPPASPAASNDSRKAGPKTEDARSNPRWHSFLPGMFR